MAVRQILDVEKSRRHTTIFHTSPQVCTYTHILKTVMHLIYNSKAWDAG